MALSVGALAAAFMAAAIGTPRALAHAGYESSSPAPGEVVAEMPPQIDIFFSQEVARSGGLPEVIVVNSSGDQVDLGATLNDDDRTLITVDMPPAMPDGRYTVIWHTLSDEDGEEARGAFDFFVGAEPTPEPNDATPTPGSAGTETPNATPSIPATPAPTSVNPTDEDDDDSSGVPIWALIGGIAAGAAVGFAGGIAAGRRKETPTQ